MSKELSVAEKKKKPGEDGLDDEDVEFIEMLDDVPEDYSGQDPNWPMSQ